MLAILIGDSGFVWVGEITSGLDYHEIAGHRNIRRWGTSEGLVELANHGPTPNTILDPPGELLQVHVLKTNGIIRCNPAAWVQVSFDYQKAQRSR